MLAGQIALMAAAAFAGAAFYINFAEHPARMTLPAVQAARQWAPSYARGFVMQASLAVVGGLSALVAWHRAGGALWLAGGLLMLANWPYTLLVIMPTNKRLLAGENQPESEVAGLLRQWNRLHAVRTGLGLAGATVLLLASVG